MILGLKKKKRRYRLTREGKKALQLAAWRGKPWLKSTGPRTILGKVIARQNRLAHGLYSRGFEKERREFLRLWRGMRG